MSEAWVVNASPLILLARVDRLDLIDSVRPLVEALRSAGMFLDDEFMNDALAQVGE